MQQEGARDMARDIARTAEGLGRVLINVAATIASV